MIFNKTPLEGLFVIELEKHHDERGFFARSWCAEEFKKHGLNPSLVQCNVSLNHKAGTLRGLHFQAPPSMEAKLVRCTKGRMFDVAVDIRPESKTYLKWYAIELSESNHKAFYIPEGFAHGFQTLEDNTEVFYQMSEFYAPELTRGLRWDDPKMNVQWPNARNRIISDRDQSYPRL